MAEFWSKQCEEEDPTVQGESSSEVIFLLLYGLRDDTRGKYPRKFCQTIE